MSISRKATEKLIPSKFAINYKKEYKLFYQWKKEQKVKQVDKNVMLAYDLDAVSFLIKIFLCE